MVYFTPSQHFSVISAEVKCVLNVYEPTHYHDKRRINQSLKCGVKVKIVKFTITFDQCTTIIYDLFHYFAYNLSKYT